ncbi:MAG: MFS transporter [Acidimicrobiales bacterium]
MTARERQATYREVFAVREYRAIFAASALSWIGDMFSKVAISVLIFNDTDSVALAAAGFAVGYLPWVAGGPVLAALAERRSYRRVMIGCDLGRMLLVGTLAIPGLPLPVLFVLLFAAALLTPPFEAARSALLPAVLEGDRYVVALSAQNLVNQVAQVGGYVAGGALAAVNPRGALAIDAATFALSGLLLWRWVRPRPPALAPDRTAHLLRDTADGFRVVFSHPVRRAIALIVFAAVAFAIVPEGLAVGWADDLGGGARTTGFLMAAGPIGVVVGAIVLGRLLAPSVRIRLIRPLAVLAPIALVPALFEPPIASVLVMVAISGFATSLLIPANGLFVQVLPKAYRARAFGVMQGGLQITHAVAVVSVGAVADLADNVAVVIGAWCLFGTVLLVLLGAVWPSSDVIDREIEATKIANEADMPVVAPEPASEPAPVTPTPATPSPATPRQ